MCVCVCLHEWYSQSEGSGRCSRRKGTRWLFHPQKAEHTIWGNRKAQPEGLRARSCRGTEERQQQQQQHQWMSKKREPTRVCETFGLCKQLGTFIKRGATRYVTNCLRVAFIAFVPTFLHTDYQVQRDCVLCLHLHETGRPSGVDATVMLGGNVAKQNTCCDLIMYRGFI